MSSSPSASFTCLGFDYGQKHIGVAVGQTLTQTARPLPSLTAQQGVPSWKTIEELILQWRPRILIVGRPLNMDGSEQWITQRAIEFSHELETRFRLPVKLVDERLSSVSAREDLFSEGGYRALQKDAIDGGAAKIILEDWLRSRTALSNSTDTTK